MTNNLIQSYSQNAFNHDNRENHGLLKRMNQRLEEAKRSLDESRQTLEKMDNKRLSPNTKKKIDDFLDSKKHLEKRQELVKQAFEIGFFDDAKEVVKKGAKLWTASNAVIPVEMAKMLPAINGDSLNGTKVDLIPLAQKYNVSLVSWVFSAFGEPHVKSFIDPFMKRMDGGDVGLIQLNIEEKWIKMPFLWGMRPWIKAHTLPDRRDNYLTCFKDLGDTKRDIGISNAVLGWVTLVDKFGRIRWVAHGLATEEEIETLIGLASQLRKDPNYIQN